MAKGVVNFNILSGHQHDITTQLTRYLSLCRQLRVHFSKIIFIFGGFVNLSYINYDKIIKTSLSISSATRTFCYKNLYFFRVVSTYLLDVGQIDHKR